MWANNRKSIKSAVHLPSKCFQFQGLGPITTLDVYYGKKQPFAGFVQSIRVSQGNWCGFNSSWQVTKIADTGASIYRHLCACLETGTLF
jgi:hypothetical protein